MSPHVYQLIGSDTKAPQYPLCKRVGPSDAISFHNGTGIVENLFPLTIARPALTIVRREMPFEADLSDSLFPGLPPESRKHLTTIALVQASSALANRTCVVKKTALGDFQTARWKTALVTAFFAGYSRAPFPRSPTEER